MYILYFVIIGFHYSMKLTLEARSDSFLYREVGNIFLCMQGEFIYHFIMGIQLIVGLEVLIMTGLPFGYFVVHAMRIF